MSKRFTKKDAENLRACIDELTDAAIPMSNICFNLSQCVGKPIDRTAGDGMANAQVNWDRVRRQDA